MLSVISGIIADTSVPASLRYLTMQVGILLDVVLYKVLIGQIVRCIPINEFYFYLRNRSQGKHWLRAF